ncbi:N-acetylserotonin O-methyltransferase-like protein [Chlorella vulgaris]
MCRASLLHTSPLFARSPRKHRALAPTAPRAMLLEHLPALEGKRIVLASASPRRRDLLQQLGLQFEVVVSTFEETLPKDQYSAADYARHTASHKAMDVAQQLFRPTQLPAAAAAAAAAAEAERSSSGSGTPGVASQHVPPVLVIGADTVVEHGDHILEKPADAGDAARMLHMLSGTRHHVHTGVALVLPPLDAAAEPRLHSFSVTTIVEFDELSAAAVQAYVASGEPFGKAGSYGIQGMAGSFVHGIQGCYFNVLGAGNADAEWRAEMMGRPIMEPDSAPAAPASVPSPAGAKRRPGRPPAHSGCQVCGKDLSDLRLFHQRYHICVEHMMSQEVMFKGSSQRFCQQCGRFHQLDRFSPGMRSCRQQLAKHAERRRRGRAIAAANSASTAAGVNHVERQQQLALLRKQQLEAEQRAQREAQAQQLLQGSVLITLAPGPEPPSTAPHSPARDQPGTSASSGSTHSTQQRGASLSSSAGGGISGMEALLAAAEEEECAEQAAEEQQQQAARKRRKLAPSPELPVAPPDLSWFQAPAAVPLVTAAPAPPCPSDYAAGTWGGSSSVSQLTPDSSTFALPNLVQLQLPALADAPSMPPPTLHPPQPEHPAALQQLLQQLLNAPQLCSGGAAVVPPPAVPTPPPEPHVLAGFLATIQRAAAQRKQEAEVQELLQRAQAQPSSEQQGRASWHGPDAGSWGLVEIAQSSEPDAAVAMPPTFPASPEPAGHGQAPKKGLSPTCSVCHRSLLCERVFHQRYHVCPEHATATSVMLDGIVQRFCQQCGRFHPMDRFSPGMRSCRHQLARHAERRRKRRAEAAAAKSQAQRCSNTLDQLAEPHATGNHATLQGHTPSLTLPPPSKRLCMGPSCGPQHAAFPPLPAGLKSEPAGGQPDAQGSGRLSGGEGDGCASAQSTHSTHRHHSHGLDALLAAAEEEQQLEQRSQQQQGNGSLAAAHIAATPQPAGLPQVAAHKVDVQAPLPMPALQQSDGAWQAMARGQQPQPRWQPPMLLVSQPVQQQQQQPPQQQHWPLLASYLAQAAAPTRQSYQPFQPAYQLQQLVQTAPAPPLLATQPQLLQLLQHLASPAASDALAALGVQLSAPPPPPATQPQQQQQPSLAAALASIQAAATQLYRPKPQPQPTSQHAALLQLVLQLAAQHQQ